MGGVICGVRVQQGSGQWTTLVADQCGQIRGRNLGTLVIAEATSFYVEVQYDCTNWWSDCQVTFTFRYFDTNNNEYDRRSYTRPVAWAGAGIWVSPTGGAILTPYREGYLRIEAWEAGQLQDYVDIGIRLQAPPSEPTPIQPIVEPPSPEQPPPPPPPQPQQPAQPELPPSQPPSQEVPPIPPERIPPEYRQVTITVKLVKPPVRQLYVAIYKGDKKLKDGVMSPQQPKLSVSVEPDSEVRVFAKRVPGLFGAQVIGKAVSGEKTQLATSMYVLEIENVKAGGGSS